jgi:hypothetical protein
MLIVIYLKFRPQVALKYWTRMEFRLELLRLLLSLENNFFEISFIIEGPLTRYTKLCNNLIILCKTNT